MGSILSVVVSLFAFRFRSRASLEIELIAVRHQLAVLRRQRPGRPQLSSLDRLLWVWLYRIWPQVIDAMVLVKPATVVQASQRFRLLWRWRSRRPERPTIGTRWMPWQPKVPSPTWRSFLRNHLPDIAAIDMFVVATAMFQLLYTLIVLSLDWLSDQMTEAFPRDTAPRYLLRDRDKAYDPAFRYRVRAMDITEVITAPRSPWHPYVERLIGSIRRECLDHVTCAACCRAIFNIS
jgi:hypothetical protein